MRSLLGALALTLVAITGASAADLRPNQSHSVDLGSVKGVAFYTVEADGNYRVVLTVAADDATSPVRFMVLLAPDQRMTMSVPGLIADEQEPTIEIARQGDDVIVSSPHLATN
jgi:hypothetical protein